MVSVIFTVRRGFSAACYAAAVLFVLIVQPLYLLPIEQQLPIALALSMMGLFAGKPIFGKRNSDSEGGPAALLAAVIDGVLILMTLVTGWYIAANYMDIIFRQDAFTPTDNAVALLVTLLTLEAVRRAVGWPLVIVCLVFIAYSVYGRSMPSLLIHRGYSFQRTATHVALSYAGIYGQPLAIMIRYVIIFMLFGNLLQVVGASDVLVRLAQAVAGRYTGGLGKVASIASALAGTVSGSAAANVVTTGTVTIPAMKKSGYPPHVAGAIEAVASTGGQVMPPIMGAAAFLMADYLGVPYGQVALAATLPALLYFFAAGAAVDLFARSYGLRGVPKDQLEPVGRVLRTSWMHVLPILVIYVLLVIGYSPTLSALIGVGLATLLLLVRRVTLRDTIDAIVDAGQGAAVLNIISAGAGIVVGIMQLTGLGPRLAAVLVDVSGGNVLLLLVLTMVTSIVLGMGMPTTVVYVLLASLVAPALVRMGIDPMAAHFFIFYFGVLAAITPPVALASYAAASIAGSPPDKTGWTAFKFSIPTFIVPFFVAMEPTLLMKGSVWAILLSTVSTVLGVYVLSVASINYLGGPLTWVGRVISAVAALLLIHQGWETDLAGLALFAIVWWSKKRRGAKISAPPVPA